MTITVIAVNDPPVAQSELLSGDEDSAIVAANLLNNDYDPENDAISLVGVDFLSAAGAALVLDTSTSTVTYTPPQNYFGTDQFSYTIEDSGGEQAEGQVTVVVAPVNDAPSVLPVSITTGQGSAATFAVYAADPDGDQLGYISSSVTGNGGAVLKTTEGEPLLISPLHPTLAPTASW